MVDVGVASPAKMGEMLTTLRPASERDRKRSKHSVELARHHARQTNQQLLGTWTVVSWEQKKGDGTKLQQFGPSPKGIACFDAGGRYIIRVMRSDRPRYASNALWQGTATSFGSERSKYTANKRHITYEWSRE
jgi:hypothetical protein